MPTNGRKVVKTSFYQTYSMKLNVVDIKITLASNQADAHGA